MSGWLVSVPIWGKNYMDTFRRLAAPALLAAASRCPGPVRYLIHTDQPDEVRKILDGQSVEVRRVSNASTYVTLQESHADAIRQGAIGERVVLLNADLVVSGNLLEACAAHFAAGKQAVVLLGIRTMMGADVPPVGAEPRQFLEWAWAHRHQIIRDLEWPHGSSMIPTNLFWEDGACVVARGFHLHPVAVVKHCEITFQSTIDGDLLEHFARERIHVVTDPDDCAMLEVSPPERRFPVRGQHQAPHLVARAMQDRASDLHRWLFTHRIVVRGVPASDAPDAAVAADILARMGTYSGKPARRVARGPIAPRARRGDVVGPKVG